MLLYKCCKATPPPPHFSLRPGDTEKLMDPYFPFEDAVDVWARTFAALDIHYCDSTMQLDL